MSRYMFGLTRRPISEDTGRALDTVAKRHGARFVGPVKIPGNDIRGWFEAPNRGAPFDQWVERDVMQELVGHPALWGAS